MDSFLWGIVTGVLGTHTFSLMVGLWVGATLRVGEDE